MKRSIKAILDDPFEACDLLTPVERSAANMVAKGVPVSEVAEELDTTENAVRLRIRNAMFKLGVLHKDDLTRRLIAELEEHG